MARTDASRSVHDSCTAATSAMTGLESHAVEAASAAHVHADHADHFAASWEMAWIDLGGEG